MSEKGDARELDDLGDGFRDGMKPLQALDLSSIKTLDGLLEAMADTAFGARGLGEAFRVLSAMIKDPDCLIVGTFSGAMTMAKMGLVLCEMIDRGFLDAVVATGALVMHGLVENVGSAHFRHDPRWSDRQLYEHGYNRIYDTIEAESNLDHVSSSLQNIWNTVEGDKTYSSFQLLSDIGAYLSRNTEGRGILKSAYEKGVPVYVPAFTDSELGLDFAIHNKLRKRSGRCTLKFDPFGDLEDYTTRISAAKEIGLFTVGGGVPRNWAQQVGPYLEITSRRTGEDNEFRRFRYGIRICPEPVHWGGLSGCTYSEGVSWGKFVPLDEGGQWAEVLCDATIAWPVLMKALIERFDREGFERIRSVSKQE
jgi:deoxyhypusine synthase